MNSLQALIKDKEGGGGVPTQFVFTPFKLKLSNSTSPLENWNLTALSNVTLATVILFEPRVNATGLPKKSFPLAVVL